VPRLQILNGKRQGATFDVDQRGAVVGHRNTAPISIDDPWVSWDHARIFFQGEGYWLEDLGSTNGSFVNCVRVKRERLNHEDIIFFGKTHVIFLVPEMARASNDEVPASPEAQREAKRAEYQSGLHQIAAAAEQWTQPPSSPPRRSGTLPLTNRNPPAEVEDPTTASVGPAIPVPADEISDPLGIAGLAARRDPRLGPAPWPGIDEESSRGAHRDPFRPGVMPYDQPYEDVASEAQRGVAALDPESDPFASARANKDPFSAGEGDPFAAPRARSLVDTHHDNGASSSGPPPDDDAAPARGDLDDFSIDEQDPAESGSVRPASAAEVSSLLDDRKRSGSGDEEPLDDLNALLGDAAARTPQPFAIPQLGPPPQKRRPSEALTRRVDADAAARIVEQDAASNQAPPQAAPRGPSSGSRNALRAGAPAPPPPPPQPQQPQPASARFNPQPLSGTDRFNKELASNARTQPLKAVTGPLPTPSQVSSDDERPVTVGDLAFEISKLQDEVRRYRMALEGARQADPEKVRISIEALRHVELGRQAREIAELRRETTTLKADLEKKQIEIDEVTEDMIKKEDLIDSLRQEIEKLTPRRSPPSGDAFAGSGSDHFEQRDDELKALEF
jgi:pSer/pThr/pTyr-binding forkhead associated (FHA) protein